MSNISLIIEERAARIGNFWVGRLLPFRQKRSVGPFVFIDHMGPAIMGEDDNIDIGPHPHIGLSTLTFLFEGAMLHRDSLGTEIEINPGEVNWMTAGRGVVHSERTPEHLRHSKKQMHGLQIWVAMPKSLEQSEPSFSHIGASDIPAWQEAGVQFRLVAGEALGHRSPVPVHSPLYLIEVKAEQPATLDLSGRLFGESAVYILEGALTEGDHRYGPRQILVAADTGLCVLDMEAGTTVFLFGGEPFPEERFMFWNFVSSDKALIEQAKADWKAQRFPTVPNETGYIPLPESLL